MSVDHCTVDTEDWLGSNSCTIGDVGGGVLGSEVAHLGTNGDGFLWNDVTLPADNNKEICGRITVWPVGLTLRTEEDGRAIASAPDGVYIAQYQLYVDYVATGPIVPITFTFGTGIISVVMGWTEGNDVVNAQVYFGPIGSPVNANMNWTESDEGIVINGIASQAAEIVMGWIESGDVVSVSVFNANGGYTINDDYMVEIPAQDGIVEL